MEQSGRSSVAVGVFIVAIVAVGAVIALTRNHITGFLRIAIPVGWALIAAGSVIDIWALVYIRRGVAGRVEPLLQRVERRGPYRHVRHPVYIGLLLILIGVALRLGSWLGVAAVFLLFLPSAIHRAHLEERALEMRFGQEWIDYRMQTGLFLPRIRRMREE